MWEVPLIPQDDHQRLADHNAAKRSDNVKEILESNNGFTTQETISKTLGQVTVNGSCNENKTKIAQLKSAIDALAKQSPCHIISTSTTEGDSSISYNKSFYYSS